MQRPAASHARLSPCGRGVRSPDFEARHRRPRHPKNTPRNTVPGDQISAHGPEGSSHAQFGIRSRLPRESRRAPPTTAANAVDPAFPPQRPIGRKRLAERERSHHDAADDSDGSNVGCGPADRDMLRPFCICPIKAISLSGLILHHNWVRAP